MKTAILILILCVDGVCSSSPVQEFNQENQGKNVFDPMTRCMNMAEFVRDSVVSSQSSDFVFIPFCQEVE